MRGLVVAAILVTSSVARGETTPELGGMLYVHSETESADSAGHIGGALTLALWSGRLGILIEAGRGNWDPTELSWLGAGVRLGLFEKPWTGCARRAGEASPPRECFALRPWIGAGVVHETWQYEGYFDDDPSGRLIRNARYAAIGLDVLAEELPLNASMFFRVQRADVPDELDVMDIWHPPYETSLVFGVGVSYGGH